MLRFFRDTGASTGNPNPNDSNLTGTGISGNHSVFYRKSYQFRNHYLPQIKNFMAQYTQFVLPSY